MNCPYLFAKTAMLAATTTEIHDELSLSFGEKTRYARNCPWFGGKTSMRDEVFVPLLEKNTRYTTQGFYLLSGNNRRLAQELPTETIVRDVFFSSTAT
jgi:hypothetical protein